jgi:F-type H+-transporting ATPase subunit a
MTGGLQVLLGADISVGVHVTRKLFGLTVNFDTVWATGAALVVVVLLMVALRRQVRRPRPGRLQVAFELAVQAVTGQVQATIGPAGQSVIPLAVTLFIFIFVCNLFEQVGLGSHFEWLPAPTGDINLTLAMALFVIILVHTASIYVRGIGGYVRHYALQPFPIFLLPVNLFINIVEEIAKPITLALRLFGNLLSGTLMLSLIAALGAWKLSGAPIGDIVIVIINPVWKLFDLFIGAIQAFIFALLTILYFDTAMSGAHGHRRRRFLQRVIPLPLPAEPSTIS